jgi:hypothetical protein
MQPLTETLVASVVTLTPTPAVNTKLRNAQCAYLSEFFNFHKKIRNGLNGVLMRPGEIDSYKNLKSKIS